MVLIFINLEENIYIEDVSKLDVITQNLTKAFIGYI